MERLCSQTRLLGTTTRGIGKFGYGGGCGQTGEEMNCAILTRTEINEQFGAGGYKGEKHYQMQKRSSCL